MVTINSTSRLSSLNTKVLLVQTDTTVGFLSQDYKKLQNIKSRDTSKPFIQVYSNLKALKKDNIRLPNSKKSMIRRAKKTTFIVKNRSFRVAKTTLNSTPLTFVEWHYSTSANKSAKSFDREFCEQKTDIIVEDKKGLFEGKSSSLYKINSKKIVRLR